MEYLSKKLTATTMLLLLLLLLMVTTAVSDVSHCGTEGPVAAGACKDDYTLCVANVITELRDRTPYNEDGSFSVYYPADQPYGVVLGAANCAPGNSFTGCRNCLIAAKDWLDQNCAPFSGGYYHDATNNICGMGYDQV